MSKAKNSVSNMSDSIQEPMLKSGKYLPVWNEDHDDSPSNDSFEVDGEHEHSAKPSSNAAAAGKQLIFFLLAVTLTCLMVNGALDIINRLSKPKAWGSPCYCGKSVEEAKSLGCKYVTMSAAYLPPHCRDDELDEEFSRLGHKPDGSWTYHSDFERNHETDVADIATWAGSEKRFYTSWEWHVMHCLFYWRKLHRAQFSDVMIEPRFNNDGHLHHCAKLILSLNVTASTRSGVSMGDEYFTEEQMKAPQSWDGIRSPASTFTPQAYPKSGDKYL